MEIYFWIFIRLNVKYLVIRLFIYLSFLKSNAQAKIIYAKQNQIFSINMKTIQTEAKDGDVIDIQPKSLGTTELYPNVKKLFN